MTKLDYIRTSQVFDKLYLDSDDSSEFIEYISQASERELVKKVVDKFKDHKPYIVTLHEPKIIEDLPGYWNHQCSYRQDLEYRKVVQCKDCTRVYPWCQRFRDELGDNGFCPYGKEI